MIPGISTAKLIGGVVGALAVLAFVILSFHWKHEMTARGDQLAAICRETRTASGVPKLNCAEVVPQIDAMGQAVSTLKDGLAAQNAKVAALTAETQRQAAELATAKKQADKRAQKPEDASKRLAASSQSPERQSKPCEPSKALTEAWQ